MRYFKKLVAGILFIVMMLTVSPVGTSHLEVYAAETCQITAPENDSLVAAGYIDVTWSNATEKDVMNYDVYINGKKVITTKGNYYEFYTTEVAYHNVYVKVNYADGTSADTAKSRFGVTKKGLAVSANMGKRISPVSFKVGWYYDWGETPLLIEYYKNTEFVPMIWKSTTAKDFLNRVTTHKENGYKYVLAFNEPEDFINQCKMTVDEVHTVWKGIAGVEGINISSPVTAIWPKGSTGWFQPFMKAISEDGDREPDFISIHCYPEDFAGARMAEWFIENVVDWTWETYHKPIWITEFSTHGNNVEAEETEEFWKAVMPELDKREYVVRYAAFGFDSASNPGYGLWNYTTGYPTEAGKAYIRNGNPKEDAVQYSEEETTTKEKVTVAKPAQPKILSASKKKSAKNAVVKIKKTARAKGYQIKYCGSKSFQGYNIKNSKKLKVTLKKLEKNTTYFIKVRAYNYNANGKKQYSKWSKTKKIKMKK